MRPPQNQKIKINKRAPKKISKKSPLLVRVRVAWCARRRLLEVVLTYNRCMDPLHSSYDEIDLEVIEDDTFGGLVNLDQGARTGSALTIGRFE